MLREDSSWVPFYSNGWETAEERRSLVLQGTVLSNLTSDTAILAGQILQAPDANATSVVKTDRDLQRSTSNVSVGIRW